MHNTIEKLKTMKRLIVFFVLLCLCAAAFAQVPHVVDVDTYLIIREQPSTGSAQIGTLNDGEVVSVYDVEGEWAKITYAGRSGYVKNSYLNVLESPSPQTTRRPISWKWLIYVIGVLALVLHVFRVFTGDDDSLEGVEYYIFVGLYLVLCAFEIAYIQLVETELWFLEDGRWYFKVLWFLIYAYLLYNQIICFFHVLYDARNDSGADYNFMYGIYAWIFYVVGVIIVQSTRIDRDWEDYVGYIALAVMAIQLIIIAVKVVPRSGWKKFAENVVIYLIATTGTCMIGVASLPVAIIAFIVYRLVMGGIEEMERASSSGGGGYASRPSHGHGSGSTGASDLNPIEKGNNDMYNYYAYEANNAKRAYDNCISAAESELRQSESYESYAKEAEWKYEEYKDESYARDAREYWDKAQRCKDKAEDYLNEARYYENRYEEAKRYANSYR